MLSRSVLPLLLAPFFAPSIACQATQAPAAIAGERPALDATLARIQAAVGQRASRNPLTLSGRALNLGEEVDCYATIAGGQFALSLRGALGSNQGYDGTEVWETGFDGSTRKLALEERDRTLLTTWIQTGHWLAAGAPIDVAWADEDDDGSRLVVTLRDTPMRGLLTIDPTTALPVALTMETNTEDEVWSFDDWRDVDGLRFPHRVQVEQEGAPEAWMHWHSHAPAPTTVRSPFARPRGLARGTRFEPERAGRVASKKLRSGHVIVNPRVNGEDVGWFILDTGAGAMCIDRRIARELQMKDIGDVLAVGATGSQTSDFRRGETFQLGPVILDDPIFLELDLRFLAGLSDERISGIVGYDLLARSVLELGPSDGWVEVHPPQSYTRERPWQELLVDQRVPAIEASFEGGRTGYFRLDSGDGGTVTFHTPTVEELQLLEGRKVRRGQAAGVGGAGQVWSGTLAYFELGGHRFEEPTVDFAAVEVGALSDPYLAGNLGQGFLEPFLLVFDYSRDRMALAARD